MDRCRHHQFRWRNRPRCRYSHFRLPNDRRLRRRRDRHWHRCRPHPLPRPTSAAPNSLPPPPDRQSGKLGSALASGDINADGFDDLIMGAPLADDETMFQSDCGQVYVVFG
ncbi:MAG: hypothetical protein HC895_22440, partial [Leptolyngbyaceae cyanobacterium SM1_3_5]|nr:hypothetical protein [Leptolyngbyaceae cyanobacterium SM1_3_5]